MKELLDECAAEDSNDVPYEQSWLFRYYDMMAREEKDKSTTLKNAADRSNTSDLNRANYSNSKSEGKKAKSSSKKA